MVPFRGRHQAGLEAASARVLTMRPDPAPGGHDPAPGGHGSPLAGRTPLEYGTGVFLAPGLLATCAHVVPAPAPGPNGPVEYWVAGTTGAPVRATVRVRAPDNANAELYSHPDVALLEVPVTDHACVRVADQPPGPALYAYGCIVVDKRPLWDPMPLTDEGERTTVDGGFQFIKTTGGQVQPGASGAGTIDLATGELIGLVKISRNDRSDLGAVLIGVEPMLDAFAAHGYDLRTLNRDATKDIETLAALARLHGRAWDRLVAVLSNVELPQLASMLLDLGVRADGRLTVEDAARALLHLELQHLGSALEGLASNTRDADLALDILAGSAPFAMLATELGSWPWVDQQGVQAMLHEQARPTPRVVHLPVQQRQTVICYATRSSGQPSWSVQHVSPPDATVVPGSAVHEHLDVAVRAELLGRISRAPADLDPASVDRAWQQYGRRARRQGPRILFQLPAEVTDRETLQALRDRYPECRFAVATPALPVALSGADDLLVSLPGSIGADHEADLSDEYEDIVAVILKAAAR